ncbi:hypothetical protein BJY21_000261 [Kineosphaera limosa]|uniref:Antitoxin n=1 Tax=Kineosphaera limosa NBRC 100340 TaxID=1184609 RepID=K6X0T4_9MICO|nr:hypothetical protein [Kineosphaera limosa]NYD99076.1 hypothetical protein [Kineosphaera limosa]GAB97977.1 hypothetical protein KILIM_092_00100 [Kineosphaera limosa NBRC 100340]
MRTTIDLPDALMRAAKAKAATAGESLKVLFERALARELGLPPSEEHPRDVEYPLIRSRRTAPDLTNEQLDDILADDDAEHYAS